jgi:hypothetical protein
LVRNKNWHLRKTNNPRGVSFQLAINRFASWKLLPRAAPEEQNP